MIKILCLFKHKTLTSPAVLNQKIMIVIEINAEMRNAHTFGLHFLNPIDTSACVMLMLYYMNQSATNVDVFCATDKLNQIELANNSHSQPDLTQIEAIFQGVCLNLLFYLIQLIRVGSSTHSSSFEFFFGKTRVFSVNSSFIFYKTRVKLASYS